MDYNYAENLWVDFLFNPVLPYKFLPFVSRLDLTYPLFYNDQSQKKKMISFSIIENYN